MLKFENIKKNLKESDLGKFLALEMIAEISYQRDEKGISQRELSRISGVPQKTISHIESGMDIPTFNTVGKLLKALGCIPKITFEYK